MGGMMKLDNKITVSGTFNFTRTEYLTPPVSVSTGSGALGANASIFANVLYNPRSVDLFGLPYVNPNTGGSVYYRSGNDIQNPRWTVENALVTQNVDRFFGNASFQYDITDNLNLFYRVGLDSYAERNSYGQNKGGVDTGYPNGLYRTTDVTNTIWDHSLILNGNQQINSDFAVDYNIGVNARRSTYQQDGMESSNQVVYGVLEHFNFVNNTSVQNNSDPSTTNNFCSWRLWVDRLGRCVCTRNFRI